MTWRYTTDWTRCVRVWTWFVHPGPAQRAIALSIACGGLSGAALPAAPAAPALPWIRAPGWVQTALPFGPGGYAGGFGGYGYAGGAGLIEHSNGPGRGQRETRVFAQLDQPFAPGRVLEGNQGLVVLERGSEVLIPLVRDVPTDVPCPPGLAVFAVALAGVAVGRWRG